MYGTVGIEFGNIQGPSPTTNLTLTLTSTLIYRKVGTAIKEYVVFQELAGALNEMPAC